MKMKVFCCNLWELPFEWCRPAFAEAPARRTRLWEAGLRAGRSKSFFAGLLAPLDLL